MRKRAAVAVTLLLTLPMTAQDAAKVIYIPGKQVEADIHKAKEATPGLATVDLIEHKPTHSAIVARRTTAGKAEVHEQVSDVWYVLNGGAELVTAGSLTEAARIEPGEIRGSGIASGDVQQIAKGDFISIPAGVPHWIRKVESEEFIYLVVKFAGSAQEAGKVVFASARQMDADLHKLPLNEIGESEVNLIERTPAHAAILLRRIEQGKAEVHETQADVWYVIDGGCTFVTGGTVISGVPTAPGEIRGPGITGGKEEIISKGDFVRVPAGVPHWVKKIRGKEIVYMVVKYAEK
jgi:mannose-6-phosphate isomerase-like protein (cupin superfamily)